MQYILEAHALKTISVPGFDPRLRGSGYASESRSGTRLKNLFKNGQTKSEISCLEAVLWIRIRMDRPFRNDFWRLDESWMFFFEGWKFPL